MAHTMEREELDQFIGEVREAHALVGEEVVGLCGTTRKIQSVRIETEECRRRRPEIILVADTDYRIECPLGYVEAVVGTVINGIEIA